MALTIAELAVRVAAEGVGSTVSSLGVVNRSIDESGRHFDLLPGVARLAFLAIGIAAIGAAAAMVKMGMDAQTQLSIVAGLTGSTAKQMDYYTTALEGMGAKFGMTLAESAKGLYYVVSAGYKGADAINVLTVAMQHSAATGAPLQDVANGLTSAMNSYGASAKQATYYSDIMTTAITYGKQTTEDFAASVSKASLMASIAGVPFNQLAAAESALTEKGEPAARAFTELRFLMSKTALGAFDVGVAVRKAGGSFDDVKYQTLDLAGKLLYLRDNTGLTIDQLLKVVGGTRSAQGAFGLLVDSGKAYNDILDKMRNNTHVTADAFQIHTHTMAYAFDQVKANVSNAGFELVKLVSPVVIPFLQGIATAAGGLPNLFKSIGDWLRPLSDTITHVDGPMITFGKHIGETSTILNTHKGYLSQVRDFLAPLGDTYTQATRHTANFRGDITSTSTEMVRHKGILSNLQDFMTKTVVPAIQGLGQAFVKYVLPALKDVWDKISKDLLPALKHLWDELSPYLIPALQLLGFVLVKGVIPGIGLLIQFLAWTIDHVATTIGFIKQLATWAYNLSTAITGGLAAALGGFLGTLGRIKDSIGWVIDRIKELIGWISQIHIPDLGGILGGVFGGGHAAGGLTGPGVSLVGEQGPELAIFPTGTRIIPAAQTAALMGGSGGGGGSSGGGGYGSQTIVIQLDGRTLASATVPHMPREIRLATGQRV